MLIDKQTVAYAGAIAFGFLLCVVVPVAFRFSPVCQPMGDKAAIERTHQTNSEKGTPQNVDGAAVSGKKQNANAANEANSENEEPVEFPWYCDMRPGRRLDVEGRRFRPLSHPDPDYEYDD